MRVILAVAVVLLVLALCPYTPDPPNDIKNLLLGWFVVALLGLWLWGLIIRKEPLERPSIILAVMLLYLAVNFVAALLSSNVANSLHMLGRYVTLVLLYLVVSHAFRVPEQVWRFLAVTCVAVAVSSIYGFLQKAGIDPFPWSTREVEEYLRLPSTYGNPNLASHALNLAFIMAVALTLRRSTRWCAIPAMLILAHIFFTDVRAAKVAIPVALLLVSMTAFVGWRIRKPVRAVLVSCVTVGAIMVVGAGLVMGLSKARTGSCLPLDGSILLRYHSFYGACRMVLDKPILGFGPGNYRIDNPPYWTDFEKRRVAEKYMINKNVHNDFLEAAVEGGLASAALYVTLLVTCVVFGLILALSASEKDRRRLGFTLAACFCAFAVDGLFGFNVHVPVSAGLLFMLAGLLEGLMAGPARQDPPVRYSIKVYAPLVAALAVALALATLETRVFKGQYYFQRAMGAKNYEYWDVAYNALEKGARLVPWDSKFPRDMGRIDLNLKRPERAIERFRKAIELEPGYILSSIYLADGYFNWAVAKATDKNQASRDEEFDVLIAKAEEQAAHSLSICPYLSEASDLLGRTALVRARRLSRAGADEQDREEALKWWSVAKTNLYETLRRGSANQGQVNRMLAEACAGLGEDAEAERAFRRAVELNVADQESWRQFYRFAVDRGQTNGLMDALNAALSWLDVQEPVDADTFSMVTLWLAEVYRQRPQEIGLARQVLIRALRVSPNRLDLWGAYAAFSRGEGQAAQLEEGLAAANAAIANRRETPSPVLTALEIWLSGKADRLVEGAVLIEQAAMARAKDTQPKVVALEFAWIAELFLDAVNTRALDDQARGEALMALGHVHLLMESWASAETILENAMPVLDSAHQAECLLQRAEALGRQGRYADAEQLARDAVRRAPNSFEARYRLAQIHAKAGWKASAREQFKALLDTPGLDDRVRQQIEKERAAVAQD